MRPIPSQNSIVINTASIDVFIDNFLISISEKWSRRVIYFRGGIFHWRWNGLMFSSWRIFRIAFLDEHDIPKSVDHDETSNMITAPSSSRISFSITISRARRLQINIKQRNKYIISYTENITLRIISLLNNAFMTYFNLLIIVSIQRRNETLALVWSDDGSVGRETFWADAYFPCQAAA